MASLFDHFDVDDDGVLSQAEYRSFVRTCGEYTNGKWSSGHLTDSDWQAQWPIELERFQCKEEGHVHKDAFVKLYTRNLYSDEETVSRASCTSASPDITLHLASSV